jgi:hypothetical protein
MKDARIGAEYQSRNSLLQRSCLALTPIAGWLASRHRAVAAEKIPSALMEYSALEMGMQGFFNILFGGVED